MPGLTNKMCLNPGPPPEIPPWRSITTRELQDWLQISAQTAYNWISRRTGPPRTMSRSNRAGYVLAEVRGWIDDRPADSYVRAYIEANEQAAGRVTWDMPREMADRARLSIVRVQEISSAELQQLTVSLDRHGFHRAKKGQGTC